MEDCFSYSSGDCTSGDLKEQSLAGEFQASPSEERKVVFSSKILKRLEKLDSLASRKDQE